MTVQSKHRRALSAFLSIAMLMLAIPAQQASAELNASLGVFHSKSGCGPGQTFQGMATQGPFNEYSFPRYYTDHKGVPMDLCDDPNDVEPLCGNEPLEIPGEPPCLPGSDSCPLDAEVNWWHEVFYSLGNTSIELPWGSYIYVSAVEGVVENEPETAEGALVFSRIRHRLDLPNDPACAGVYIMTHPYGVDTFEITEDDITSGAGRRAVNATDDCLHGVPADTKVITPWCGLDGTQFNNPTNDNLSRINSWLKWDPAVEPQAPPGHAGDLLVPHKVVGSQCGTNFVRVEGPCIPDGMIETDLFSVMGRYVTDNCGDGFLDTAAGETCDDGNLDDGDCCRSDCTANTEGLCDDGLECTTGDFCQANGECFNSGNTCSCGDVSGDGAVTIIDALLAAQYQVRLKHCAEIPAFDRCDASGDGSCDIVDALIIAQSQVGLHSGVFECGLPTCEE